MRISFSGLLYLWAGLSSLQAESPGISYIFPAGARRGTTATIRVGGFYFHGKADFSIDGSGLHASPALRETETVWFEGPRLFEPASQQKEDYPKDYLGQVTLQDRAPLGIRHWSCRTSQGATPSMKFVIGDLPEIVEKEIDGAPLAQNVILPVTINGRIFPRENVDEWRFHANKGEIIAGEVASRSLGYPLQAVLEVTGPGGRPVESLHKQTDSDGDPKLWFTAPESGAYQVAIHDAGFSGGQNFVYRLTLTSGPRIEAVYPLGGRRGETVQVHLAGPGLKAEEIPVPLTDVAGDSFAKEVRLDGRSAGIVTLQVNDLPESLKPAPGNHAGVRDQEITPPVICNGRIDEPGDVDSWPVRLEKGQSVLLEIFAARLGSKLDSDLSVCDTDGKELARNDDRAQGRPDSMLLFTASKAARYIVKVRDHFASRGGAAFGYRLRVTPQATPDFQLTLANDAVNVLRQAEPSGEAAGPATPRKPAPKDSVLRVDLMPVGAFTKDVSLEITGLPVGVTAEPLKIRSGQKFAEIHFTAPPRTPLQLAAISIRGSAEIDGKRVTHEVPYPTGFGEPKCARARLAIVPPVPFKLAGHYLVTNDQPGGTTLKKHYLIERGGFEGPLTVCLADRQIRYLRGVTGPSLHVPAGVSEFDYPIRYPSDIEQGHTSRVQLMVIGELTDFDGTHHTLSYTSAENDDQIISITTAGLVQISLAQSSFTAAPNSQAVIPVTLQRDPSLASRRISLELRVPQHISGVTAAPIEVGPGVESTSLHVEFGPHPGPFNMPLTITARTIEPDSPVYEAEAKLDLVAP